MARELRTALAIALIAACGESPRDATTQATISGLQNIALFTIDDGTIASARLSADARIIVVARPNILAVYDSSGIRLASLGRNGSGPGEFRMLMWAAPGGADSVWAFDFQQRRLNLFGAAFAFADSWRVVGATTPNAVARIGSGAVILVDPFMPVPSRSAGISVDTVNLLALLPPATAPTRLARIPWTTRYQAAESVALIAQPLGPVASVTSGDSSVFVAFGDRAEVLEYDAAGKLLSTRALQLTPRAITPEEVAWARALAEQPSTFDNVPPLYRSVPLPTTAPLIAELRVNGDRLWVKEFQVSDSVPTTWRGFSVTGAQVDSLSLPAGTQLLDLRGSWVLLKITDPSGDESVALYRRQP